MPEWIVPGSDNGKKLITFLTERLGKSYSARALKRILEMNHCQLNGKTERFASTILKKGDHILLKLDEIPTVKKSDHFEQDRILFEDEYLLIYNKPAGVTSDEKGIVHILKKYCPAVRLVHRLDRDTTGILIFAKDKEVFDAMVSIFKEWQVKKNYLAIVDGLFQKNNGSIDNYLGKKHFFEGQAIWGSVDPKKGLHAYTEWMKVKDGHESTLLYCYPKTGRTHQIRVHLSGIGHPVLGDYQYSKKFRSAYQPNRMLLHAYEISFKHPITHEIVDIKAPIPEDFKEAENILFK